MNRSEAAIRSHASPLNLTLAKGQTRAESEGESKMTTRRSSARPWTPTDDDRLRALATAGTNPKAIGMELNRHSDRDHAPLSNSCPGGSTQGKQSKSRAFRTCWQLLQLGALGSERAQPSSANIASTHCCSGEFDFAPRGARTLSAMNLPAVARLPAALLSIHGFCNPRRRDQSFCRALAHMKSSLGL